MSLEKYLEAIEKGVSFTDVVYERSLTPEEKKKREEIAQAIERDHPEYSMEKKMAIATAKAKECCDEVTIYESDNRWELYSSNKEKGYTLHHIPHYKAKKDEPRFKHTVHGKSIISHSKRYPDEFKKHMNESEQLDEAGTQHPLPGHEYHRKTDAELRFIAKDAKEAEDAMSGHNPKAANKYADQKNDAATVLHFRKKGMPDWYKKKYGHIKEETELTEEKDTSALDAMDAKERRKDKIRKYIKNQSPIKIKRTPGKSEVNEEVELVESSDFHAKPTESSHEHYALVDHDHEKSGFGKREDGHNTIYFMESVEQIEDGHNTIYFMESVEQIDEFEITHHAIMNKNPNFQPVKRKDGHRYVGMAGHKKKDSSGVIKSGMIVQHKDTGKYTVGNVSDKSEWHDKVEDAVVHAHKRFKIGHTTADKVHVEGGLQKEDFDEYFLDKEVINEELDKHLKTLTDTLTAKSKAGAAEGLHTEFSVQTGKKYHKIIGKMKGASGGHVHAFVDKETGDVYKPAGYNAPAKGVRYNLHKDIDHLAKHADQYGSYLYKR